jgi:twitching motility protein PilT
MRLVESTSEMRKKLVRALARNPLFSEVKPELREALSDESEFCIFESEEVIVQQGDSASDFFVILKGSARAFLQSDGDDAVSELAILGPMDALGEMGLLLDQPRSASVVATDQVLGARLSRSLFDRMITELPAFGRAISVALASRLSETLRKIPIPQAAEDAIPGVEVLKLLPVLLIQRHRILPLGTEGSVLILGCVDEVDLSVLERVKALTPGMEIRPQSISRAFFEESLRSLSTESPSVSSEGHASPDVPEPLRGLMLRAVAEGVSDLHLTAGLPPRWRLDGDIETLRDLPVLGSTEVLDWLLPVMREDIRDEFERTGDADFAVPLGDQARFRVNLFRDNHGVGSVLRQIPSSILTVEQLGLPDVVLRLASAPKGMVLVTGATGSGKSTTLAAMVDHLNRTQKRHIITLEDPIEFVHSSRKALINQREVGVHTDSFHRALRAALRQDPDIVLVGELRDRETIELALEVANTGHLVLGTLHTTTAMGTVDRIVDIFPSDQQAQIRTTLAEVLRGVVSQALCKRRGGGRVAAIETLVVNAAVANLIRKANTAQIVSVMQTQSAAGNRLLNSALQALVSEGRVDYGEAASKAVDKDDLARRCGR